MGKADADLTKKGLPLFNLARLLPQREKGTTRTTDGSLTFPKPWATSGAAPTSTRRASSKLAAAAAVTHADRAAEPVCAPRSTESQFCVALLAGGCPLARRSTLVYG